MSKKDWRERERRGHFSYSFSSLKASIGDEAWRAACVLDPNELMRLLEAGSLAVVFAFKEDLKYPHAVSHLPFLCRLKESRLVALKAGAAGEFNSYFSESKKPLFMFALKRDVHERVDAFVAQFVVLPALDPSSLPTLKIKKSTD